MLEKLACNNCSQMTPRNMHNKCVYCGTAYEEKYHFNPSEKNEKLAQLEKINEEDNAHLEARYKKEAARGEVSVLGHIGDFLWLPKIT